MIVTESVGSQVYIFIWSVFGGMIIAFIYDIFRIIRKAASSKKIALYIEDFIYWIIAAFTLFWVMYAINDGEMRGFFFIGSVLGVTTYALLLSKPITALLIKSIKLCVTFIWNISRVLSFPVKIIIRIVGVPLLFILRMAGKGFKQVKRAGKTSAVKASFWKKAVKIIRKKI
jgi:spore cortex biosynthesis protein YabQ